MTRATWPDPEMPFTMRGSHDNPAWKEHGHVLCHAVGPMKKHLRNAAWALAGVAFLAVSAGSIGAARADCLSPAECICSGSPADAVLAVTVTAVLDNKDIEGTVDSVDVAP